MLLLFFLEKTLTKSEKAMPKHQVLKALTIWQNTGKQLFIFYLVVLLLTLL